MLIIIPCQAGPCMAWLLRGRASHSVVWFLGGSRVLCGMVCYPERSSSDRWPHPSFLAKSVGADPSAGRPTPVITLLMESVLSGLLGRNW
jgi:hypothetical protein